MQATWNPRPNPNYSLNDRKDYHAGYSDGWYRYKFGSGHDAAQFCDPYCAGYQQGLNDSKTDAA